MDSIRQVLSDEEWSSSAQTELLMHSIHSYPAKFPALIANKAIEYAYGEGVDLKKIADIFCGCGTVPLEAKVHGIDFWGTDINPVATLIARTKSQDYDVEKLKEYFQTICSQFERKMSAPSKYSSANARIQYWFTQDVFESLDRLLQTIYISIDENDSIYLDAFLCIFSSILKTCSKWLMKSIKPQVDPMKKIRQPLPLFQYSAHRFIRAVEEVNTSQFISRHRPTINIEEANFLDKTVLPRVDLIISSPPYVTSYEYADLHQLSSLWLGYTDDYKSLRKGSVGSSYGCASSSLSLDGLNKTAIDLISKLQRATVQPAKIRAIARYYKDIQVTIKKCFSMLRNNGMVLFVIGDTEYRGVSVTNAQHLVETMESVGFTDLKACKRTISQKLLTPYRDRAGRFTSNKQQREIYHEEFVISARK